MYVGMFVEVYVYMNGHNFFLTPLWLAVLILLILSELYLLCVYSQEPTDFTSCDGSIH